MATLNGRRIDQGSLTHLVETSTHACPLNSRCPAPLREDGHLGTTAQTTRGARKAGGSHVEVWAWGARARTRAFKGRAFRERSRRGVLVAARTPREGRYVGYEIRSAKARRTRRRRDRGSASARGTADVVCGDQERFLRRRQRGGASDGECRKRYRVHRWSCSNRVRRQRNARASDSGVRGHTLTSRSPQQLLVCG